jgi:hypothetical protein
MDQFVQELRAHMLYMYNRYKQYGSFAYRPRGQNGHHSMMTMLTILDKIHTMLHGLIQQYVSMW